MDHREQPTQPSELDELLTVLANNHCRTILSDFRDTSGEVASLDDLANRIADGNGMETERVVAQLHHSVLPKLVDTGLIEYDIRSGDIRYHGHRFVEKCLDLADEWQ